MLVGSRTHSDSTLRGGTGRPSPRMPTYPIAPHLIQVQLFRQTQNCLAHSIISVQSSSAVITVTSKKKKIGTISLSASELFASNPGLKVREKQASVHHNSSRRRTPNWKKIDQNPSKCTSSPSDPPSPPAPQSHRKPTPPPAAPAKTTHLSSRKPSTPN